MRVKFYTSLLHSLLGVADESKRAVEGELIVSARVCACVHVPAHAVVCASVDRMSNFSNSS